MPVNPTYPGVYVQEAASGARAVAGVATSIAAFVGMAENGPMDVPTRIFNFADFERNFGTGTAGELATQVRNFYLNGGGQAYVMRIAAGALRASVTLEDQSGAATLTVSARDPGLNGNQLRVEVDYNTATPEETFNLTVYRSVLQADGTFARQDQESFANLSMNSNSSGYADTVINGNSALITVAGTGLVAPVDGVSIGGSILRNTNATAKADLDALVIAGQNALQLQVGDNSPVPVVLTLPAPLANIGAVETEWTQNMNDALAGGSIAASVTVTVPSGALGAGATGGTGSNRLLFVESADGPVRITQAASDDCTLALALGSAQGGIEGSEFGDARPAPSGFVARTGSLADGYRAFRAFAGLNRDQITQLTLTDDSPSNPHPAIPVSLGGAVPMFDDGTTQSLGNALGLLDMLASAITDNSDQRWQAARHGLRLAMVPQYGSPDTGMAATLTSSPSASFGALFSAPNTAGYTVGLVGGSAGPSPFQAAGSTGGTDGNPAGPPEYAAAYTAIDRDVDLFNLLVLPRNNGQTNDARRLLWGPASSFCERKRAILIVDPNDDWDTITAAETGVNGIRVGVATRNSVCYWPRLAMGGGVHVDPSGAMAGVMARTDGNRGVWKAPAGLEATIRGVTGVQHQMTDPENGVINPAALNAIRLFPAGVVSWGARTLVGFNGSGNVDDKYLPVRRTMLMIEEALARGLRFAVFEPNDEPLWAQIRLAAGSYMNGLFRQGAFAGAKSTDAYFVQCDSTTTTATDINLGIVNVLVGFAPLKPAEYVVLTVKQIAGQVQV